MKKLWILPLAAIMFSCGAPTEEAPVAEPVEEVAPVEEVEEEVAPVEEEAAADSTMEAAADSTMEEASEPAEEHDGHDH